MTVRSMTNSDCHVFTPWYSRGALQDSCGKRGGARAHCEMGATDDVQLSRDEFNRATKMFDDMDTNHDGVVDMIEFQAVMANVAKRSAKVYTFEHVRRMFMEADVNGDGYIDYEEWIAVQKRQKAKRLGVAVSDPQPQSAAATQPSDSSSQKVPPSKEGLRDLLSKLAGATDVELAGEAAFLLHASLERDAEEGTLPDAREADRRALAATLSQRVSSAVEGGRSSPTPTDRPGRLSMADMDEPVPEGEGEESDEEGGAGAPAAAKPTRLQVGASVGASVGARVMRGAHGGR